MQQEKISKLLSFVLRHRPDEVGITVDEEGWTAVDTLLGGLRTHRRVLVDVATLRQIVESDEKGRYSLHLRSDGLYIRANQGHSLRDVHAVDETPRTPPARLYHGTTLERWAMIGASGGLRKMRRHHVHLSDDLATAQAVGARHRRETPCVLTVDAARMQADGHVFHRSENGVWLTDAVPLVYLSPV